jgi:hypothetical protein
MALVQCHRLITTHEGQRMTEHYTNDSQHCATFHTVNKELYTTKDALKDAVDCKLPIRCMACGLAASDIPQLSLATFGLAPLWYVRLGVNLSGELYIKPTSSESKR